MQNMKSLYLSYANNVIQGEDLFSPPQLDHESSKLLEIISVAHAQNKPLTVTEAMRLRIVASPASIHRKLDQLRELGYVDGVYQGKNRRTRYLMPLSKAEMHFKNLGQAISEAAHAHNLRDLPHQIDNNDEFHC